MEFKLENGKIKKLDTLAKTYRSVSSYLKLNDSDLDEDHQFAIYDANHQKLEYFETSIAPNKPAIDIQRMRLSSKDLQVQEEVLKGFADYLWNYNNTQHFILRIGIYVPESGISDYPLIHQGFCDDSIQNMWFSKLNPLYPELVETFAENDEVKDELMKYYNRYQSTIKIRMQKRLQNSLQSAYNIINDDTWTLSLEERERFQQEVLYYTEALHNLNATATPQQKEMVFKR